MQSSTQNNLRYNVFAVKLEETPSTATTLANKHTLPICMPPVFKESQSCAHQRSAKGYKTISKP